MYNISYYIILCHLLVLYVLFFLLSLRHSNWKYPGKAACHGCSSRRHRNHSPPPAHSLSGSARRPPAGFWRRMQDVVCQLMGIGMAPRYVRKAKGIEGTARHGDRHGEVYINYFNWNEIIENNWNNLLSYKSLT